MEQAGAELGASEIRQGRGGQGQKDGGRTGTCTCNSYNTLMKIMLIRIVVISRIA